jgi:hypothetical protein
LNFSQSDRREVAILGYGIFSYFFCSPRVRTQGLMCAEQVLYYLCLLASLFFFVCVCVLDIFEIGSSFLLRLASNLNLSDLCLPNEPPVPCFQLIF